MTMTNCPLRSLPTRVAPGSMRGACACVGCIANPRAKSSTITAARTRGAAGFISVVMEATKSGPTMKLTSSVIDSHPIAVANDLLLPPRAANIPIQRARPIGPICGELAPMNAAITSTADIGTFAATAANKPARASALTMDTGIKTFRCHHRSVACLIGGPTSPDARPRAPEVRPAATIDPRSWVQPEHTDQGHCQRQLRDKLDREERGSHSPDNAGERLLIQRHVLAHARSLSMTVTASAR